MITFSTPRDEFYLTTAAAAIHDKTALLSGDLGDRLDLSIYVSCYNERQYIVDTLKTIRTAMEAFHLAYEIVLIDDASKDESAALVEQYIAENPNDRIVFRKNTLNKGWAQNYIDAAFIGKGKYYRAICGDNALTVEAIREVFRPIGQADIIIPYYVDAEGKDLFRRVVSRTYTALVNLISGNRLHYYNGSPIHRRYNVMRWHTSTRGFGFQADILCLLLAQGASYIEIPTTTVETREGASNALTWKNFLSVAHTLTDILLRRLSNRIHGRIDGRLGTVPDEHGAVGQSEDSAVQPR
jgi:glycosyltransferase involved in cell wall biosynthesis